jgi:flagellar biosynthesis protein FlhA
VGAAAGIRRGAPARTAARRQRTHLAQGGSTTAATTAMTETQATGTAVSGRGGRLQMPDKSVLLPTGVVVILAVLIVPLPAVALDVGLTISLLFSVLVLMVALLTERPLHFSSFPVVLLVATMIRLSLNLASTRLILSEGDSGTGAAGEIIQAFAEFVMQGEFLIGLIVFAILVTVNFVVINKGATRIAEVTARFTLDSMPGKQMAIDADLSSGIIGEQEAKRRREELQEESGFYGSMDGASKFVRGDAIAGIIIVFINLVGGILVGTTQHGMTIASAAQTYATLTVGDGLVTQIPAVIVSIAAGMLVSKGSARGSSDDALFRELGGYPNAFWMVAVLFLLLALIPGLPFIIFTAFAGMAAAAGWYILQRDRRAASAAAQRQAEAEKPQPREETPQDWLQVDELSIQLGEHLARLIVNPDNPEDPASDSPLGQRIKKMRGQLAHDYGFIMPDVRLRDNPTMDKDRYEILVQDTRVARGSLDLTRQLVIGDHGDLPDVPGEEATEPAFGLPAKWVTKDGAQKAEDEGYFVVEPVSVLSTHFHEVVKTYMPHLLSYAATQNLLDNVPRGQRRTIDDLVPNHVPVTTIHQVLRELLAEGVSIKNLPVIVEAIGQIAGSGAEIWQIVEHVRTKLALQICTGLAGEDGQITALQLSRGWEEAFAGAVEHGRLQLNPSRTREFAERVSGQVQAMLDQGLRPVILTSKAIRPFVRSVVAKVAPDTPVLAHDEHVREVPLQIAGEI